MTTRWLRNRRPQNEKSSYEGTSRVTEKYQTPKRISTILFYLLIYSTPLEDDEMKYYRRKPVGWLAVRRTRKQLWEAYTTCSSINPYGLLLSEQDRGFCAINFPLLIIYEEVHRSFPANKQPKRRTDWQTCWHSFKITVSSLSLLPIWLQSSRVVDFNFFQR